MNDLFGTTGGPGLPGKPTKQEGLVMKPQYDLNKFIPGTVIFVASNGATEKFYRFNYNCLVVRAEPLKLTVVYIKADLKNIYDDEDDKSGPTTIDIPIELVAEGKLQMKFLNSIDYK